MNETATDNENVVANWNPIGWLNGNLIRKELRSSLVLMVSCASALFLIGWLKTYADSKINTSDLQQMMDVVPEFVKQFIPANVDFLLSYTGRMAITFDHPIVFLCMAVFCITRCSDVVSGQLGRGTLEILLAQPISRMQVLVSHSVVTLFGIVVLAFFAWAGIALGVNTLDVKETVSNTIGIPNTAFQIPIPYSTKEVVEPMSKHVDQFAIIFAPINYLCVGFLFCGLTTLLSAMDRYRWRTIGIMTGFYVVQLALLLLGEMLDDQYWLEFFSVLSAYKPTVFVGIAAEKPDELWNLTRVTSEGNIKLGFLINTLILVGVGTISYILSAVLFVKRDLPAPV